LGALALFSATVLLGRTTQAEPLKGAPAPFNKGGVKMALSNYLSTGDFFQA
jgi:simple sugar transport system substrate-binding protein